MRVAFMTRALDMWKQGCFTFPMTTRTRESIYDKAERILSDPTRVIAAELSDAPDFWTGRVVGDHGTYVAVAVSDEAKARLGLPGYARVACVCPAGRTGKLCSHAIVAEEMRLRGEDS